MVGDARPESLHDPFHVHHGLCRLGLAASLALTLAQPALAALNSPVSVSLIAPAVSSVPWSLKTSPPMSSIHTDRRDRQRRHHGRTAGRR